MNILLLAGTSEARALAEALTADGHDVVVSLAGVTRASQKADDKTRVGGFGGREGFAEWLDENQPDMVVDATHPFANNISSRTADVCAEKSLPYLQVLRDGWFPTSKDMWIFLDDPAEAAEFIAPDETVFLATGRQTLQDFECLSEHKLFCRQIDPPEGDFPFSNGEFVVGAPPFSVEDEVALFKKLKIHWLITKNAGGEASFPKLEAARALRIPVLLLNRPAQPDAPRVATIEGALRWIKTHAPD